MDDTERNIFDILRKPVWMTQVRILLTTENPDPPDHISNRVKSIKLIRQELSIGLFEAKGVMDKVLLLLSPDKIGPETMQSARLNDRLCDLAKQIAA